MRLGLATILLVVSPLAAIAANAEKPAPPPAPLDRVEAAQAKTTDPGPIVTDATTEPATSAGVRAGDVVLAMEGWRVHDAVDLLIARSLQPHDQDTVKLLVIHHGQVQERTLKDIVPMGEFGMRLGPTPDRDAASRALARRGLALDGEQAHDLDLLPARVAHELDAWQGEAGDGSWAQAFVADYVAVLHGHDDQLAAAAPSIPVPFLARLDAFYRAVAAARAAGEDEIDPERWGVDRWFAARYYPFPWLDPQPLGKPALGDAAFAALLEAETSDPAGSLQRRREAATDGMGGDTPMEQFLGQVKASLLDEENHGGWPFRSVLVWERPARTKMVSDLRARVAANGEDADLARYALVGPLMADGASDQALAVIAELAERSPYLASRAADMAGSAGAMHNHAQAAAAVVNWAVAHLPVQRLRHGGFYAFLAHAETSLRLDDLGPAGAAATCRRSPELVADALAGVGWTWPDEWRIGNSLNNLAWTFAVDPSLGDGEQATALAEQMARLLGSATPPFIRDTIAADYARAGDFESAQLWQRAAMRWGRRGDDYAARLTLYEQEKAFTKESENTVVPTPAEEKRPDSSVRCRGSAAGHSPVGAWTFLRPDASVEVRGYYDADGHACGVWRWYEGGKPALEATYVGGHLNGRVRRFSDGAVVCEGWFDAQRGSAAAGRWEWRRPDGTLAESGRMRDGRREGPWTLYDAAGAPNSSAQFSGGGTDGKWAGSELPEIPQPKLPDAPRLADAPSNF